MADSRYIVELQETIEKMNAELSQPNTKISELCVKVREQEEAAQKEMAKLREENARLSRDLKESKEKCNAVQERLKFVEQKLAEFSQKVEATAEKSLAQVDESNDGINSLPDEIILKIFGYLRQNQLGEIARVCRRWSVLTRGPILWKKVNVHFPPSHESQTTVAEHFINLLPPCVTHLRLNFFDRWSWIERFHFEEISVKLEEKCPNLEVLILEEVVLTDSLPSVIDLCTLYLRKVKILAFHFCEFPDCPRNNKCDGISKIEVLELNFCDLGCLNKPSFSQLPYLKQLHLNGTCKIHSWFHDDTSFINQLHVLDLGYIYISSRTFQAIQNHGHILSELYLCGTYLDDIDLSFNNSVCSHLKTICLGSCSRTTYEGVISLIQSCPSLLNVYVDENVAESYAAHPFVVANRCKAGIIKSIHVGHTHNYLLKTVEF